MALQPTKLVERLGSFTAPKGHLLGYMCAHLHLNGWKEGREGGGAFGYRCKQGAQRSYPPQLFFLFFCD